MATLFESRMRFFERCQWNVYKTFKYCSQVRGFRENFGVILGTSEGHFPFRHAYLSCPFEVERACLDVYLFESY